MRLSIHKYFYHNSPKSIYIKSSAISLFKCIQGAKKSCAFSLNYFRKLLRSAVSWINMLDCIWTAFAYCEPFSHTLPLSQYIYCLIKYFPHFKCYGWFRPASFLQVFLAPSNKDMELLDQAEKWPGASPLWRQAGKAGAVQSGEEAVWRPHSNLPLSEGAYREVRD